MSEMVSEEPSGKAAADKKEAKKSSEGKKSSNDTSKVRLFFFFLLAPIWFGLCLTSSYLSVLQVVIRRLPPTMTEAVFVEQVGPFPPHDYFYFVEADKSLEPHNFSRYEPLEAATSSSYSVKCNMFFIRSIFHITGLT